MNRSMRRAHERSSLLPVAVSCGVAVQGWPQAPQ